MRKKKQTNEPLEAALNYISSRARTVREVENRLDLLNYAEYDVYQAVERLKELGYLNDEKYAADFVETRLATKPMSRRRLREQLYAHFVPQEIINETLSAITDEQEAANALKVTEKYARQYSPLEQEERKQRVARRVVGRGFDYGAIRAAMEAVFGDASGVDYSAGEEDEESED